MIERLSEKDYKWIGGKVIAVSKDDSGVFITVEKDGIRYHIPIIDDDGEDENDC